MSIVSSQIVEDHAQIDGRRMVRERHVDQLGEEYEVAYIAEANADVAAALASNAVALAARLAEDEILANYDEVLA